MARLEQVAQARYAGGLAAQADAIRAQLEQTAMRSELIMLDSEKRQIRARLNALLARESGAPLADPLELRPIPT
jgi:cobalt-zinc-cadmium efflux system outer membrane protein